LTTEADFQDSLHWLLMSAGSDRLTSQRLSGCQEKWWWVGDVMFGNVMMSAVIKPDMPRW